MHSFSLLSTFLCVCSSNDWARSAKSQAEESSSFQELQLAVPYEESSAINCTFALDSCSFQTAVTCHCPSVQIWLSKQDRDGREVLAALRSQIPVSWKNSYKHWPSTTTTHWHLAELQVHTDWSICVLFLLPWQPATVSDDSYASLPAGRTEKGKAHGEWKGIWRWPEMQRQELH